MADWYGNARSNYFKVKDLEKYKAFCSRWGLTFIQNYLKDYACTEEEKRRQERDEIGLYGFTCENTGYGGMPSNVWDDDGNEIADFDDFLKELSQQLEDGWVAVFMECGAEKLRYITGYATAVNSKGETKNIDIWDIYKQAKELGEHIERCEY